MNIYFSGIGGVGIGPLAEIALDAGYGVFGSDVSQSLMTDQLEKRGVTISLFQDGQSLEALHSESSIDRLVYTAALPDDHPELIMAKKLGIRSCKRDELLAEIIAEKKLKLIAISGTHGKTTTTGMMIWALQQLGVPISYSVGASLSFGPSGKFDPESQYFVYECDEFDRNMLHFTPWLSVLTSLSYDHIDTYKTEADYTTAFREFIAQSNQTILWQNDSDYVQNAAESCWVLQADEQVAFTLAGEHNRRNATLILKALEYLDFDGIQDYQKVIDTFPGTFRRFEKIAENLYSDYGHHPNEIAATLQMASEYSKDIVLVYQPHQNVRQHEVKDLYTADVFTHAKKVYWLPTYQSREHPELELLLPEQLSQNVSDKTTVAELDDALWRSIQAERSVDNLVLCMGAGSIDQWIRKYI